MPVAASLATILAQDALREAHGRHRTRPRYGRGLGQAETLDVDWQATDAEVLDDLSASVHGDTFGYYDPLMTVTQDQALCILGGTHVMILGDSISRYFTYQFNNFLINGDVAAEFGDEGDGCLSWGCATEISGVYSGPYFDSGKKVESWYGADTWYDDLEDEASEINEGDVLIVNSGWWELKEDDEEDHASDGCSFSSSDDVSDFYRDSDCLDSYETDLENLVAGILRYFVNDDDKAVVWRMTTCCGVDDSDLGNQRIGAIAVGAMNTIADKVMADNGIDTANVYQLSNIANLGTGAGDGTGRTFDAAACGQRGGDYRTFQAAGHANSSGAGTKGGASALEDELSNSALQVLRQMEDIEVRSGPAQLASVAEEDEERGEEALGKGSKSRPAKASTHSAGRHRSSAHRSGHRGGSMRGGMGSSYAPRTSISLVNKTLSMTAQSRTSSYAEPHLDTKASSVAFSFYDGGDSDDDDDGDAPIPAPPSAGTGPAVPSKDAKRGMTYEAARAALEFAVLLGVCVVGEHRMPSGRLPAGTTLDSENPDLWAFIMALLFLVSLLNVEVLEEGTEVFLSRAQANEWKGWMQVAFVAYRRGVRRCAGASAAGRRGTPWIEYFVALATVHFVLIWVSLAIARVIGTLVGWEKPDKKEHREACYAEKALGCALMIGLCCIIWLDPHNDGKGVYDVLLRPWLLDIDGEHYFEWYFWMRTKMDFLSSVPGLCFAAVYTPFRDAWPFGISRLARWGMGACASTLIALAIWRLPPSAPTATPPLPFRPRIRNRLYNLHSPR
ncbi:N-acetylneuraminate 7-O(or 9-O)-acetyltransferase [Aureococcus anophagefferens]|nr:N-acetylneuraminate 7-O(or 9-O)-acetyltransferase [Aureococcus anophagefferens]